MLLVRDEKEERKKQARANKQTKQSNTAHFPKKNELPQVGLHVRVHVLMRDEKEKRSKQGQTNNKAKQHSTPKAVDFS